MLHAEPVQTAEEFASELFLKWTGRFEKRFINTAGEPNGDYELLRAQKPKVRSGTWFLYENEDADDASKLYEKANE